MWGNNLKSSGKHWFESLTCDNASQYHQLMWGGKWSQHWVRWSRERIWKQRQVLWCNGKAAGRCRISEARECGYEHLKSDLYYCWRLQAFLHERLDCWKIEREQVEERKEQWKPFFQPDWQVGMNKVLSEGQAEVSGRTEGDCCGLERGSVSHRWKDGSWIHVYKWDYPQIRDGNGAEGLAGFKISGQRGRTNLTTAVLKLI